MSKKPGPKPIKRGALHVKLPIKTDKLLRKIAKFNGISVVKMVEFLVEKERKSYEKNN